MTMEPTLEANREPYRFDLGLWTAVLGPPILWFGQFQLNYYLVLYACSTGRHFVFHLAFGASLLLTVGCGLIGWKLMRPATDEHPNNDPNESVPARPHFMAVLGMMGSGIFVIVTIAQWIGAFMINPCWD